MQIGDSDNMKRVKLEQWEQDIILTCKGRYELSEEETTEERLTRICLTITGGTEMPLYYVKLWMYRVWEKLREIEECRLSKSDLQDYMLGVSFYHRHPELAVSSDLAFSFLFTEIQMCRVFDEGKFELILEENENLKTEYYIKKVEEVRKSNEEFMSRVKGI